MKILAFATLATLASTNAFCPPRLVQQQRQYHKPRTTALQVDILGTEVDAAVLAAAGLALVGGIGVIVLKGQVDSVDDASPAPVAVPAPVAPPPAPAPAPAPAPVVVASVDLSIPYDAAAKKAYEEAGSPGDYAAFKAKFEADAVAGAIAKKKARDAAAAA